MKKLITSLLVAFVLFLQGNAQVPSLTHTQFASGFSLPVSIAHCQDDRLFVVEQRGKIKIANQAGTVQSTPFLDIDSKVINSGNERGLLGLAFHPDYKQNGYFYVYYIGNSGGSVVSRFSVSPTDSNMADAGSELILLQFSQPYSNHNGGCIHFGPDGYLYIGTGDGGSAGDPAGNGQKKNTYLGKMLRIDVDGGAPYAVPASNPFVGQSFYYPEIWALGLRNPWRFSFDRVTGDMWIGDVGQDNWEEIDYQPANSPGGENYGWKCREGNATYSSNGCGGLTFTDPVFTYTNNFSYGCSVTGGFVYRGGLHGSLYGYYLHADYCTGRFWLTAPDGLGGFISTDLGTQNGDPSTFGEDAYGELYWASLSSGVIYKISVSGCNPTAVVNGGTEICQGGTVMLSTPSHPTLSYQWYLNGAPVGNTASINASTPGAYHVIVSNGGSCSSTSDTINLVQVMPATASISSPQTVFFNNDPTVNLTGMPAGGFFSGPGISTNGVFDPAAAGVGTHQLVYHYPQSPCGPATDTVEVTVNLFVSVDNPNPTGILQISPNPTLGPIAVSFVLDSGSEVRMEVLDLAGRIVFHRDLGTMQSGEHHINLDPGKLAAGNYLLRLATQSQFRTARFTVK